jgi:hypothetical protein
MNQLPLFMQLANLLYDQTEACHDEVINPLLQNREEQ